MAGDDNLYRPYKRTLAVNTPFARKQFESQYEDGNGSINAVSRAGDPLSPSGTNWNQTFGQNNPYSPSGTDWNRTFGSTSINLPSGIDWSKTFSGARIAGDTTPPPSPGDIDSTFFGGPTPTPTPTPKPSLASNPIIDFHRNRMADSTISQRDLEKYGAGSDFGFT